ncbi:Uncharacterised protein [Burkholderia pseudomallei]|nr:Uncharacterised protein [Burkholderia pseudomallei]CAJ3288666.1 Uncharacterised protein [Burkholderia pseudomallei]CAJ3604368.1 Uncharacterised protein [Burkholderia pseudomallei]CAJ3765421.1 Uncharacterised protein [Burkholderia pseudomallei]CAJ3849644.1 Uncharacterised protein [Burkholderia pseudomallei]
MQVPLSRPSRPCASTNSTLPLRRASGILYLMVTRLTSAWRWWIWAGLSADRTLLFKSTLARELLKPISTIPLTDHTAIFPFVSQSPSVGLSPITNKQVLLLKHFAKR